MAGSARATREPRLLLRHEIVEAARWRTGDPFDRVGDAVLGTAGDLLVHPGQQFGIVARQAVTFVAIGQRLTVQAAVADPVPADIGDNRGGVVVTERLRPGQDQFAGRCLASRASAATTAMSRASMKATRPSPVAE